MSLDTLENQSKLISQLPCFFSILHCFAFWGKADQCRGLRGHFMSCAGCGDTWKNKIIFFPRLQSTRVELGQEAPVARPLLGHWVGRSEKLQECARLHNQVRSFFASLLSCIFVWYSNWPLSVWVIYFYNIKKSPTIILAIALPLLSTLFSSYLTEAKQPLMAAE